MKPQVIGIIPARFGSTRFPGKALAKIKNKEMVLWVAEAAKKSKLLSRVVIATDDQRIKDVVQAAGFEARMTPANCPSGSDRVWLAAQDSSEEIIVNIQGDEPLLKPELLDALVSPLVQNPNLEMSTLAHSVDLQELQSMNSVKVLLDKNDNAIYFSRYPIPYSRVDAKQLSAWPGVLKHMGLYAYRREFLEQYCKQSPVEIESGESLEQLRALYLGAKIRVVRVNEKSWGVDTPEDLKVIEKMM